MKERLDVVVRVRGGPQAPDDDLASALTQGVRLQMLDGAEFGMKSKFRILGGETVKCGSDESCRHDLGTPDAQFAGGWISKKLDVLYALS